MSEDTEIPMQSEHQERGDLVDTLRVCTGALAAALAAARARLTAEQNAEVDRMLAAGAAKVGLLVMFDGAQTHAEVAMLDCAKANQFDDPLLKLDGSLLAALLPDEDSPNPADMH